LFLRSAHFPYFNDAIHHPPNAAKKSFTFLEKVFERQILAPLAQQYDSNAAN